MHFPGTLFTAIFLNGCVLMRYCCFVFVDGLSIRNQFDERLLTMLNAMNTYSETFVICDCRPRINAVTNRYVKGKGYENVTNYKKAHIIFFDIQNIHKMRDSVQALKRCCEDQQSQSWLKTLHGVF